MIYLSLRRWCIMCIGQSDKDLYQQVLVGRGLERIDCMKIQEVVPDEASGCEISL